MPRIVITYASREGQTLRIAQHLAKHLREQGVAVDVFNAADDPSLDISRYTAAIVAASVHVGKHEKEIVRFVKRHAAALAKLPTTFISVSLSAAGAQGNGRTDAQRERARADVRRSIETFAKETGWQPSRVEPVAGALLYTHYNWLVRFIMKRISQTAGGDTDTTRDFEYTDWAALDRLAREMATEPRPILLS